jgi:hypothetical protein
MFNDLTSELNEGFLANSCQLGFIFRTTGWPMKIPNLWCQKDFMFIYVKDVYKFSVVINQTWNVTYLRAKNTRNQKQGWKNGATVQFVIMSNSPGPSSWRRPAGAPRKGMYVCTVLPAVVKW